MAIIEINTKLIERRNFLHRAIANHNASDVVAAEAEIEQLDKQIKANTAAYITEHNSHLKSELEVLKKEVTNDGDFKRGVAKLVIKLLEPCLGNDDIKGVMRQGYKIMRAR